MKSCVRREFFNLKDQECQKAFLEETSNSTALSSSFSTDRSFPHNANVFFKNLKGCIRKCFKKVRIRNGGKLGCESVLNIMEGKMKMRSELKIKLKNCMCRTEKKSLEMKLEEVEEYLSENCAAKNAVTVREYIKSVENGEGNFSQIKLWKLKQKLCPKKGDPPMAKKDENGSLITSPELLKSLYLRTYQKRLENRPMKSDLLDVYFLKQELWNSRLEELRKVKTLPWTKDDLRKTLHSLKNNKTMDPNGMISEIFKDGCIGKDLEDGLLKLMNLIKEEFFLPEFVIKQNIPTIYKNKESRLEMDNDRGIIILVV